MGMEEKEEGHYSDAFAGKGDFLVVTVCGRRRAWIGEGEDDPSSGEVGRRPQENKRQRYEGRLERVENVGPQRKHGAKSP